MPLSATLAQTNISAEAPSTRPRSPPPKQVVLLSPSSITPGRRPLGISLGGQVTRIVFLILLIALALWHLYASLQLNVAVGLTVHVPPAAMQF